MSVARVYTKGQVTIPKAIRDATGIEVGDRIVVEARDDEIVLRRPRGILEFQPPASHPPESLPWAQARHTAWEDHLKHKDW